MFHFLYVQERIIKNIHAQLDVDRVILKLFLYNEEKSINEWKSQSLPTTILLDSVTFLSFSFSLYFIHNTIKSPTQGNLFVTEPTLLTNRL